MKFDTHEKISILIITV